MIRQPLTALLAIPLIASSAWSQTATTLGTAAAKAGLNFGIATNSNQVSSTTSAYVTAAKNFSMVVCENEMKFDNTEGPIGTYKYNGGDGVSTFAVANGMKMRGHNFIWHSQSNTASAAVHDRTTGLTVMRNHIENVGGHFKTKILEWDVLNEITADGGGLRSTFWRTAIGDDYADSALAISRRVIGTNGNLYYNDYGGDGVNTKSTSMLNLAKKWQAAKVPIDGIGLQCHLNAGINKTDISANIKRFGDIGLRISLTEIDIKNGTTTDWTNLLGACLENFNCVSFVTWGLSDQNSWLGSGCNCLLYSGSSPTPKAHVQALIDLLNNADPTIAAKRKEFAAAGSTPILHLNSSRSSNRTQMGRFSGAKASPAFSFKNGMVDPLGRALPVIQALP